MITKANQIIICGPSTELTSPPIKGTKERQINKLCHRYHRLCSRHTSGMLMFDSFELGDCIIATLDRLEALGINTETYFLSPEELIEYNQINN